MKKLLIILMTMFGLNNGCANAQDKAYVDMDVAGFTRLLQNDNVQLLDVRTPEEFADGHINGAKNIDIYNKDFIDMAEKALDKSKPVAVYCRSGKRSAEAAELLSKNGYKVTNLKGGILAWNMAKGE